MRRMHIFEKWMFAPKLQQVAQGMSISHDSQGFTSERKINEDKFQTSCMHTENVDSPLILHVYHEATVAAIAGDCLGFVSVVIFCL